MSFIGDIVGGIMGANAAGDAANVESQSAKQAQDLIAKQQQDALDFQKGVWSGTQENQQPFLDVGQKGANQLSSFLDTPFVAPTLDQVRATPGYQFQQEQGIDALDKSAAAKGNLFSGTQNTDLLKFGTGLADSTYGEAYNRAMTEHMNQFGILSGTAQLGANTASNLANEGNTAAGNVSNVDLTGADMQAKQINNAAAARASGYLGTANAWSNMAGGLAGAASRVATDGISTLWS